MRDIKRETDRASSQVNEALRMSQVSRIRGLVEGSSIQRGIDELNKLLSVESVAGKNLYQLAGANLNIPNIHCSQYDGHTHGVRRARPTFVLKPTAKNAKIIQNAYGRALKYKLDLIQLYITCVGTDNAMSAPKRHKPAHEDDSLTMLPQKCQLGPFLDLTTVEGDGSARKKDDSTELVLAFLLPSGDCRYVEAISGSTREKAALGKHLVVPVSDGVIKLLYELYREMKASLGMKPTSSRSGARTSAPR
ncbi:hypothetical protein PG993_000508 [Apiospora rasikravindrae]|uniref:Uncharacterized protein n=1 Tax=Apiospora rasikravindrae TaxID=990691 RepID=A0ABR1UAU9_9PEZI